MNDDEKVSKDYFIYDNVYDVTISYLPNGTDQTGTDTIIIHINVRKSSGSGYDSYELRYGRSKLVYVINHQVIWQK